MESTTKADGARLTRQFAMAGAAALVALAMAACGGGGGSTGGASETAQSYTEGPVSGFGSIIVNGVRFDDSAASVSDDDDSPHRSDDIKLGMMVQVDAGAIDRASARGTATRIRFGSEIVGPVGEVGASSLVVLGQTVDIKDTTVFDDSIGGGLAGIGIDDVVEVHAQFDASSGHYVATRIEDVASVPFYRLRGIVSNLNATDQTFDIGGALISYASVDSSALPANFANGLKVRVRLQKTQVDGAWVAESIRSGVRKVEDHPEAEVHGLITRFDSSAHFAVDGLEVDAGSAGFPDGTSGLTVGARVEVEGAVSNGVLVAARVKVDDDGIDRERFELHGAITQIDGTVFTLRGVQVRFDGVDAQCGAALTVGTRVEVKGLLSADRTKLVAVRIRCES